MHLLLQQLSMFDVPSAAHDQTDETRGLPKGWRVMDRDQPREIPPAFWRAGGHDVRQDRIAGWIWEHKSNAWIARKENISESWVEQIAKEIRKLARIRPEDGVTMRGAMIKRLEEVAAEEAAEEHRWRRNRTG